MNAPAKRCTKCSVDFPATSEYFHNDKSKRDGLCSTCKECAKQRSAKWVQDNPEQAKATKHNYYLENCDVIKAKVRQYERVNKDKISQTKREYTKRNAEKFRQYRIDNKEHRQQLFKQWYAKHPNRNKERKEYNRQYQKTHRHIRKARKLNLPNKYNSADWQRALNYFNGVCAVCGRPPGLWHTLAMDHWIALSSPDCPGTVPTNIVPLCHGIDGCNNSKHNQPPDQWLIAKFGEKKAKKILERIHNYFDTL